MRIELGTTDDPAGRQSAITVRIEQHGRVARIMIDRDASLNAFDSNTQRQLREAFNTVSDEDEIGAVILTGAGGRAFSTGGDLKEMAQRTVDGGAAFATTGVGDMLASQIERCPKPVIAAIDGYCIAGGLELALACDIRVATTASSFGLPEVARGLIAGPGLISLRASIPLGEALMMHLTGDRIGAERAYSIGLIQALVADRPALDSRAMEIAAHIAGHDPYAVTAIKALVRQQFRDAELAAIDRIDAVNASIAVSSAVGANLTAFAPPKRE